MRNRERDARQKSALEESGWKVITVWECELVKDVRDERLEELYAQITARPNGASETEVTAP